MLVILFGGVPHEVLFDNMATVVDRLASTYKTVVINKKFAQFAKDVGFAINTCRPYRPQTKGYGTKNIMGHFLKKCLIIGTFFLFLSHNDCIIFL